MLYRINNYAIIGKEAEIIRLIKKLPKCDRYFLNNYTKNDLVIITCYDSNDGWEIAPKSLMYKMLGKLDTSTIESIINNESKADIFRRKVSYETFFLYNISYLTYEKWYNRKINILKKEV